MQFKKLYNGEQIDLIEYITDYVSKNPNTKILVGTDSQNTYLNTTYAIVVAMYQHKKGAHVLYRRWKEQRNFNDSQRLLNEVWKSVEVAELIRESNLPKVEYIDIDLNPDPKYKSNEVFRQAVGLVEGMGYKVRYKTLGPIATYAADHIIK